MNLVFMLLIVESDSSNAIAWVSLRVPAQVEALEVSISF